MDNRQTKKERTYLIVNFDIPADHTVKIKEKEKETLPENYKS